LGVESLWPKKNISRKGAKTAKEEKPGIAYAERIPPSDRTNERLGG
jgi:hypothetical protein